MDGKTAAKPLKIDPETPIWIGYFVAGAMIAVYAAAMLPNILSSNYIRDEIWFAREAVNFDLRLQEVGIWRYIFGQINFLGYGPIYWISQTFLTHFLHKPLVAMRVLGLVCYLAVPVSLVASRSRRMTLGKALAVMLWWTFPAAWWTGKLTGPELPALAAGAMGLAFLTYSGQWQRFAGWVMLGMALGIKATSAPLLAFAAVLTFGQGTSFLGFAATSIVGTVFGFILACPIVLVAPKIFLASLRAAKGQGALVMGSWANNLSARLDADTWTWDALPNGGLTQWSLAALPLALFVVMLCWGQARMRIGMAFLVGATLSVALCVTSEYYYGWYWFGTLPMFPFAWIAKPHWSRVNLICAAVLVAVSAAYNASTISERYALKMEQQQVGRNKGVIQACVERAVAKMPYIDTVLDYSELELNLDYGFLTRRDALKPVGIINAADMAFWAVGYRTLPPLGSSALMVIGDRLKRVNAPSLSAKELAAKIEGAQEVEFIDACFGMQLYHVNLYKS